MGFEGFDYQKLLETLKGHRVWIQTHNFPDPDAISSAYGLKELLKYHGIKSHICYSGQVEKISVIRLLSQFSINARLLKEVNIKKDDYVVLVDCQRYNSNLYNDLGNVVAVIDHHKTVNPCEYQYKDVRIVGACATLIAEYYSASNTPMSKDVATALIYGIKMDTDSLNRGVSKLDLRMMEYLYDIGDHEIASRLYNNGMELKDLRAFGAAIESIRIEGNMGFARIPFQCADGLIAMIADFIMSLDGVETCAVYSERDDGLKFSIRCGDALVHAGDLTALALEGIGDGGGHFTMAGGLVSPEKRQADRVKEDEDIVSRFKDAMTELGGTL